MARRSLALAALAALAVGSAHAATLNLPVETRRVSVSSTGKEANARSEYPTMSSDGRYVVFESAATTLVPGGSDGNTHVYVHDRLTGETVRASESAAGEAAQFGAEGGSISRNGRYVVFYSLGANLAEGGRRGVFRKDLDTGEVEMVSAADGSDTNRLAWTWPNQHAISDDGRYITFATEREMVSGVGPPANGGAHIYVRDMETRTTKLVSVDIDGNPGTHSSQVSSISGNGHVVFFETRSALDPRDTNDLFDVYAHNHIAGTTEWVSTNNYWEPGDSSSWRPRANYDGSLVVFDSTARNLVPRDQGGISPDVFLRDLTTKRTEKVSVSSSGEPPNLEAFRGSISSDGRFVAYWSSATNHVPEKTAWNGDVFVRDLLLGYTELVSLRSDGGLSSGTSQLAALSGDAMAVSFMSNSDDLVPDVTNGVTDVFARQVGPSVGFVVPIKATVEDDGVQIEGLTKATGALLARAEDPEGDLVADELLAPMVGDISAAEIAYRTRAPQELLFRVRFHDLPFPVFGVAQPGTTYGVSFRVDGRRFEIRMNAAEDIAFYPTFDLYACEPVCILQGSTPGGFGTVGHEIHFTVSLNDVQGLVGSQLTDVTAFAGVGGSPTGAIAVIDDVSVPDTDIPPLEAGVALEPAGTDAADAAFSPAEAPQDGELRATLPIADVAPGSYEVFARICIADACGYGSAPVQIGGAQEPIPQETLLAFTAASSTSGQYSDKTLFEARLVDEDENPIEGAELTFELSGQESSRSFSATTDADGVGSVMPTLEEKPGAFQLTVRFAGDDDHAASADTIPFVVEKKDTATELTVQGQGRNMTLRARLSHLDSPSERVAGRTIDFYSDGELIGSDQTNSNGVAEAPVPPGHRGANRTYEAVFSGDDFYRGSSDTRPGRGPAGEGETGATSVQRSWGGSLRPM